MDNFLKIGGLFFSSAAMCMDIYRQSKNSLPKIIRNILRQIKSKCKARRNFQKDATFLSCYFVFKI